MPPEDLKTNLAQFVAFAQSLKGDEKSESQSFIDQFFRALGHKSAIEAGATFEFRVAKKPGSAQLELVVARNGDPASALRGKGGKKFADLLWPDRVLIEMKSRGENLELDDSMVSFSREGDFYSAHRTGFSKAIGATYVLMLGLLLLAFWVHAFMPTSKRINSYSA